MQCLTMVATVLLSLRKGAADLNRGEKGRGQKLAGVQTLARCMQEE